VVTEELTIDNTSYKKSSACKHDWSSTAVLGKRSAYLTTVCFKVQLIANASQCRQNGGKRWIRKQWTSVY
jgi:hypothetical protein